MKILKKILKIFCLVLLLFTLANNINLSAIIIDIVQEGGSSEENGTIVNLNGEISTIIIINEEVSIIE